MENRQIDERGARPLTAKTPSTRSRVFSFLAVMLAIDLVEVYFYASGINSFTFDFDELLLRYLIISQTVLVSIWVGLGGVSVTLRVFVALAFIEGWCFLLPVRFIEYLPDGYMLKRYPEQMFDKLMPVFLLLAILLWAGRLFGLRLLNLKDEGTCRPPLARFQFSLRCLLEWTAIVAAFLGSLNYIFPLQRGGLLNHYYWFRTGYLGYAASYACLALLLTWAVLGIRARTIRLLVQTVFAFVAVRLFYQHALVSREGETFLFSAILLGCLWYLRAIGFRMVWQFWKRSHAAPTNVAPLS
jgi:hypothetical protein